MKKYLWKFENPFLIKIYDLETEKGRSTYNQRKIVYIGEDENENSIKAIEQLFPTNQFVRRSINVAHLENFPLFKVVIFNVLNYNSTTLFFDKRKQ